MTGLAHTSPGELLERYSAVLLDSYGVLVHHSGTFPGAIEFVARLNALSMPFLVLTNDASRLPDRIAAWYERVGLAITSDQIVTSGHLLVDHFADNDLGGARCAVLGTDDSRAFVTVAGGEVAPLDSDQLDAVIVCDDAGYPLLETLDHILTVVIRQIDRGRDVALIVPNPDLIYPKGGGHYGITAGSVALVLEAALEARFPGAGPKFARLGKPHAPMYAAAERRLGTRDMVMVGDQISTDVAGAAGYGLDSALVTTGVSTASAVFDGISPTWILESLEL